MYTLYGMTGSCSMAVHAILNELNQPLRIIDVRVPEGQPRRAEFLKLNPRGSVPVLVDDGHVMREGGAIITYLLDKHESPMLPKSGPARATALEWLMFANATLHPAYSRIFFIMGAISDPDAKAQALEAALKRVNTLWAEIDTELAHKPFLCGQTISAADLLLSVIANWGFSNHGSFAEKLTFGANTKRLLKTVSQRASFAKALKEEGIDYRAAA